MCKKCWLSIYRVPGPLRSLPNIMDNIDIVKCAQELWLYCLSGPSS